MESCYQPPKKNQIQTPICKKRTTFQDEHPSKTKKPGEEKED